MFITKPQLRVENGGTVLKRLFSAYSLVISVKSYYFSPFYFTCNREPRQQIMKPSDALACIFGMITGICKRHFPYVKFHCGPLCPSDKCPGYQGDYISHPGVQRACSRRHVFKAVVPAGQEAMTASFFCVNQNFKEQLKEWVVKN